MKNDIISEVFAMKNKILLNRIIAAAAVFILLFALSFTISYFSEKKNLQSAKPETDPQSADIDGNRKGGQDAQSLVPADPKDPSGTNTGEVVPVNQNPVANKVFDQPQKPAPQNKIIYLTFDAGPGAYTEQLLDILKENNAKATFFVTAIHDDYLDLITREAEEGHSVAVHSLTHEYATIYSSVEAFWKDFDAMNAIIREKTGSETLLMRFPGGSSNTVSKITPGIMTTLTKQMKEKGYYYFDWNVDSNDAGGANTPEEVFENCKRGVEDMRVSMILCHDIKEFTVKGMEKFVPWAIENGYTFLPLTTDDTSFNAHHTVNN